MTAMIGTWSLALAVLAGAAALAAAAASVRFGSPAALTRARQLTGVFAALITAACGALAYAMAHSDFAIAYVATYTERSLPIGYKLAAFWAGQEGSILLWAWLLAAMSVVVVVGQRRRQGVEPAVTLAVLAAVGTFFAALMVFAADPFKLLPAPAPDGHGLNPLLQHPSMIAHPPLLFVGYAGFTVPFAILLGTLAARREDNQWIMDTRRWLLFSWLFLTVGIVLGAQWAYVELGWGGYWAWDPVENASLLPWLTGTAVLHSVAAQRYRGMFKVWNACLIAATFILCIFGTYLTRSGVIQSVHAFGESLIGTFFLVFMILCLAGSAAMLIARRGLLKSEHAVEGLLSRESAFVAVNVLLTLITLTVLIGTIFPVISQAVAGRQVSVGPPFYNKVVAPMAVALLGLMAFGPLLRSGRAGGAALARALPIPLTVAAVAVAAAAGLGLREAWALAATGIVAAAAASIVANLVEALRDRENRGGRGALATLLVLVDANHRRYGGQIVHVGMLMVMVGVVGSSLFGVEKSFKAAPGDTADLGRYTMTFHELVEKRAENYTAIQAHVVLTAPSMAPVALHPQMRFYDKSEQPHSEVALNASLVRDIYVTLAGWEDGGNVIALQVIVNPLVSWIWVGGLCLSLGGLLCLFPRLAPRTQTVAAPRPRPRSTGPVAMPATYAEASS